MFRRCKNISVSYNFGEYGGINSINANFDGILSLVSIGFGKESINQNCILGNYHGPENLCLWNEILADTSNFVMDNKKGAKSRLLNFEGGLIIDTALLEEKDLNFIVGQFNYGEVICEVRNNLTIISPYKFTGPFLIDESVVFVCDDAS